MLGEPLIYLGPPRYCCSDLEKDKSWCFLRINRLEARSVARPAEQVHHAAAVPYDSCYNSDIPPPRSDRCCNINIIPGSIFLRQFFPSDVPKGLINEYR